MLFRILTLLFLIPINLLAFSERADSSLKVGYTGSEPFVMADEKGMVIDLWKEISYAIGHDYELISFESVEEGLDAVHSREINLLIGPITINSARASEVTFSQPYYDTEMAILAPVLNKTIWQRIKPFFSTTFLYAIIGLVVILSIVGSIFWLVEGKYMPEEYSKSPVKGIGIGLWIAVVTMTTVGYGDFAPKTILGRVVMGSWMVLSLIMATSFVAGIATTLSVTSNDTNTITSLAHLEGKKVAVPTNQKIVEHVKVVGGKPVMVNSVKEGYDKLMDGKVDALVYDVIPLKYVFEDSKKDDFVLSKKNILPQYYGFAFPEANALKQVVDLEIIKLRESEKIEQLVQRWTADKE